LMVVPVIRREASVDLSFGFEPRPLGRTPPTHANDGGRSSPVSVDIGTNAVLSVLTNPTQISSTDVVSDPLLLDAVVTETITIKVVDGKVVEVFVVGDVALETINPIAEKSTFQFGLSSNTLLKWNPNRKYVSSVSPGVYVATLSKGITSMTVMRYEIDTKAADTNPSPPLMGTMDWKSDDSVTNIEFTYSVNETAIRNPLNQLKFLLVITPDNSVKSCSSNPPCLLSDRGQKILWTIEDFPPQRNPTDEIPPGFVTGKILARLETTQKLEPQPMIVMFQNESEENNMTGMWLTEIPPAGTQDFPPYKLAKVKYLLRTGKYSIQ